MRDNWILKIWHSVRSFFRYKFSKEHIKLVIEAFKGEPWDETYLFNLEYAKIKEMKRYHEKYGISVDADRYARDMGICLSLIEIFTGKRDIFDYEGKLDFVEADTEEFGVDEDGKPFMQIKSGNLKYICNAHVNTKNADRFLPKNISENMRNYFLNHPHEIYVEKARHLYHKIRLERDEEWWD